MCCLLRVPRPTGVGLDSCCGPVWPFDLLPIREDRIRARSWYLSAIVGLTTGLLVSIPTTMADWRLQPSGMFHNEQDTDWAIVTNTAGGA